MDAKSTDQSMKMKASVMKWCTTVDVGSFGTSTSAMMSVEAYHSAQRFVSAPCEVQAVFTHSFRSIMS